MTMILVAIACLIAGAVLAAVALFVRATRAIILSGDA